MTKQPLGGRPTKTALMRIKLATAVVSVVAFAGSLGVVAYLNPGVHYSTTATTQNGSVTTIAATGASTTSTGALQLSSSRQSSVTPLVRTRGS